MDSIAELIIETNKDQIAEIISYYLHERNQAAFIIIQTGTYGRNLVEPKLPTKVNMSEETRKIYESQTLSPHLQIQFLREKNDLYKEAFATCTPGMGIVAIDYESPGVREFFDPIKITASEEFI